MCGAESVVRHMPRVAEISWAAGNKKSCAFAVCEIFPVPGVPALTWAGAVKSHRRANRTARAAKGAAAGPSRSTDGSTVLGYRSGRVPPLGKAWAPSTSWKRCYNLQPPL
eukprot:COSAG01_NODE_6291_length_3751_cov_1.987678_3_plen_110_part_00